MSSRRACRFGTGVASVVFGAGALVALVFGGSAGALVSPPGPLGSLAPDQWIVFTVSPSSPALGQSVTLSAQSGTTGADPAPSTSQLFSGGTWPTQWSANGVTLDHSGSPCPASAGSCDFTLSGSPGAHSQVIFGVGPVPASVSQPSNPDAWTVVIPEPTTTTPPTQPPPPPPPPPNAVFTGPPNNQLNGPGAFTFQAPAETGQGPYTYTWTLLANDQQVDQQSGPSYTPPTSIFSSPTATYTLSLTVKDALGASATNSIQFEVETNVGKTPPASTPSSPGPSPGASTPSPGPVLGRTSLSTVAFTSQVPRFATPTPGAVQPVTVIWLWRPDWFQTSSAPQTSGAPRAIKRADVSVDPRGDSQSATPWLAGLAAFGIFGMAWIFVRRRRVRSRLLD